MYLVGYLVVYLGIKLASCRLRCVFGGISIMISSRLSQELMIFLHRLFIRKRIFKLRDSGRMNGSALHSGKTVIDTSRNINVLPLASSLR